MELLGFLVEDSHGTVGIPHILESVRLGYRGGYARQCLMQVHQAVP